MSFSPRTAHEVLIPAMDAAALVAVETDFVYCADTRALLAEARHDDLPSVLVAAKAAPAGEDRLAPGMPTLLHGARQRDRYYAANPARSRVLVKESLVAPPSEHGEQVRRDFLIMAGRRLRDAELVPDGAPDGDAAVTFFAMYVMMLLGALRNDYLNVDAMIAQLERLLGVAFACAGEKADTEVTP